MIRYKLTDKHLQTRGKYQWTPGEWRETSGGGALCGPGWLHSYETPELAVLLNPIYRNIQDPLLWECEVAGESLDDCGLKGGNTRLRLLRQIPIPEYTSIQQAAFAILVVYPWASAQWCAWSDRWLSGEGRSAGLSAWRAATAAKAEAAAAADLAAYPMYLQFCALAAREF